MEEATMIRTISRTLPTLAVLGMGALGLLMSPGARADSIAPTSFSADLGVGDSATVRKTVVISDAPTSALIDIVFLIDTSGSMGGAIAGAKTAASNILTGLAALGDVASGTGYYSEPGSDGAFRPLTTSLATGIQNINDITLGLGGGGGDFPEEGYHGTRTAALNQAWRPASNRFIVALGDATFKDSDGSNEANTLTALNDNNITFIGIDLRQPDEHRLRRAEPGRARHRDGRQHREQHDRSGRHRRRDPGEREFVVPHLQRGDGQRSRRRRA
jgi:hypothetical protein